MITESFKLDGELSIENLLARANERMNLYESKIKNATEETITHHAWGDLHVSYRLLEIIDDLYHVANGEVEVARKRWRSLRHTYLAREAKRKYLEREDSLTRNFQRQKTL